MARSFSLQLLDNGSSNRSRSAMGHSLPMRLVPASHDVRNNLEADIQGLSPN
jgi:hypothetical protein